MTRQGSQHSRCRSCCIHCSGRLLLMAHLHAVMGCVCVAMQLGPVLAGTLEWMATCMPVMAWVRMCKGFGISRCPPEGPLPADVCGQHRQRALVVPGRGPAVCHAASNSTPLVEEAVCQLSAA
jgi:hypothetical protein